MLEPFHFKWSFKFGYQKISFIQFILISAFVRNRLKPLVQRFQIRLQEKYSKFMLKSIRF